MAHAKEPIDSRNDDGLSEEEWKKRKTKIFVGGLKYTSKDDVLKDYFEKFGELEEAVVIYDRETGLSKGYGFVTMLKESDAAMAIENKTPRLDGRKCNVNLAYLGQKKKSDKAIGRHRSPFLLPGCYNYQMTSYTNSGAQGLMYPNPATMPPLPPPHYHMMMPPCQPPVYSLSTMGQGVYSMDIMKQQQHWLYPPQHLVMAGQPINHPSHYYNEFEMPAVMATTPTHNGFYFSNNNASKDLNNNNNNNNSSSCYSHNTAPSGIGKGINFTASEATSNKDIEDDQCQSPAEATGNHCPLGNPEPDEPYAISGRGLAVTQATHPKLLP